MRTMADAINRLELEFVINRFVIGTFVSSALLVLLVVISIFHISQGASDTLSNIPRFSGVSVVLLIATIYAFIGRNAPDDTDVKYICGAMTLIMVLETVIISMILASLLL